MKYRQAHIGQLFKLRTQAGMLIAVRQATSADIGLLAGLLFQLSERALQLRYMRSARFSADMAWQEAKRMTQGHAPDHTTLMAAIRTREGETTVAVAELVRYQQDPTIGEIALVVRDDMQQQGIGRSLLRRLVSEAQRSGITCLSASMLAENTAMLQLIRSLNLPYTARTSYGETQVLVSLPAYHTEHVPAQSAYTLGAWWPQTGGRA